jgi:hypothetical protein
VSCPLCGVLLPEALPLAGEWICWNPEALARMTLGKCKERSAKTMWGQTHPTTPEEDNNLPVRDLVGATNLSDLSTPSLRQSLNDLVNELVTAERAASECAPAADPPPAGLAPIQPVFGSSNSAAVVPDQSLPPLSIVNVESQQSGTENSYLSTRNNDAKGAPTASIGSIAPQSESSSEGNRSSKGTRKVDKRLSSDDSLSSSSENKNLSKANENLDRKNVRWHNEKSKEIKTESCHKDDVTGDAVTAKNVGARFSSLQHRPAVAQKNLESLEVNSSTSSSSDLMLEGGREEEGCRCKEYVRFASVTIKQ